jgi:nitrogen PTS system EIIA component
MELTELIKPSQVLNLHVSDKAQLLQELSRRAAKQLGLDPAPIFQALAGREELGSTGVGHGIAVPHARVPGLGGFYGLFVRLDQPIAFAAIDGGQVDLVFLLLAPPDADRQGLTALAAISRCLRNAETARRLRAALDSGEVYAVLTEIP